MEINMTPKKLPKALQKKKKSKMAKVKGRSRKQTSRGSSRAMRRQLAKQGIEDMDQIDATEVIIKCVDKEIVISDPQVIQLKQQGMTVHQIIGETSERELGTYEEELQSEEELEDEESVEETEELKEGITVQEQDIMLVASQAGVSKEVAKAALEDADGDLARAILNLKTQ
ncbi:MAG: Nascent polypeptide-associated complex protein [Candidatus Lokiarchaeota archaeon]|nr:Nascent polypeptide-associated complex protein [Candidatus Lokiarchaeota archaeon]